MATPKKLLAKNIKVSKFRQIHHFPLVWKSENQTGAAFNFDQICDSIKNAGWLPKNDPLKALSSNEEETDPEVYNEFVYFYEFVRDFLFPKGSKPPYRLFSKPTPYTLTAEFLNEGGKQHFSVLRQTLHVFTTKTVILTVETQCDCTSPITLAQVQTIVDHFRRCYTPYWDNGVPQRVPLKLEIDGIEAQKQDQKEMAECAGSRSGVIPLLEPWASWIKPLSLEHWRIPSDERVPVMSQIFLKQNGTNAQTMQRVHDRDWFRLAEADQSDGKDYEYNPEFLAGLKKRFFYDRFYPANNMPEYFATRHIFGGAHYSFVTVDDGGYFAGELFPRHFRRHYEKMGLIVRFEHASLLAFSSRITETVRKLEDSGKELKTRKGFRDEILKIHEDFLEFTHRYRFTGISSQIQAGEMYQMWRRSLELDVLYQDVKDEITSASDFAAATKGTEQASQANLLAAVGILIAIALTAPAVMEFF